jgi:hypothetical protein
MRAPTALTESGRRRFENSYCDAARRSRSLVWFSNWVIRDFVEMPRLSAPTCDANAATPIASVIALFTLRPSRTDPVTMVMLVQIRTSFQNSCGLAGFHGLLTLSDEV